MRAASPVEDFSDLSRWMDRDCATETRADPPDDGATSLMIGPQQTPRTICDACRRPLRYCWCVFLPAEPIRLHHSRALILTHPHEVTRSLRTVPMLERCFVADALRVVVGRRFGRTGDANVVETCQDPENLLLFPTNDAVDLRAIPPRRDGRSRVLVVLDGTWEYARNMYTDEVDFFSKLIKVKLVGEDLPQSAYAIRKQPHEGCLCTLEAVALSLSILENDPSIFETCMRPLRAIVRMQHATHSAAKFNTDHPILNNSAVIIKQSRENVLPPDMDHIM